MYMYVIMEEKSIEMRLQPKLVSTNIPSQRVLLHITDLQALEIHHGDVLLWYVVDKAYVCIAHAHNDNSVSSYVCRSAVVSSAESQCVAGNVVIEALVVKSNSPDGSTFRKLSPADISSAVLTVYIRDRDPLSLDANIVESNVRAIVKHFYVTEGCRINCASLSLSCLSDLETINVENVKYSASAGECGVITNLTELKINVRFLLEENLSMSSTYLAGLSEEMEAARSLCQCSLTRNKGLILIGPSGCGKTSFVEWLSSDISAHLVKFSAADVLIDLPNDDDDDGENDELSMNYKSKFRCIAEKAMAIGKFCTCILFIDNIDVACTQASSHFSDSTLQRLFELELQTFCEALAKSNLSVTPDKRNIGCFSDVILIAATNRRSTVSEGVRRLFGSEITFSIPSSGQRAEIIEAIAPKASGLNDNDMRYIAEATPGFTGSDLVSLMKNATLSKLIGTMSLDSCAEEARGLSRNSCQEAVLVVSPSSLWSSDVRVETPSITYDAIAGYDDVKEQLVEAVEWPLRHAAAMRRIGAKRPRGVLLHGPPGCGKTSLVRAAAASARVNFLSVSGAQLYSAYQGQSEKNISMIFDQARAAAPSVLFIDEIDSVVGSRSTADKRGMASGGGGAHDEGGGVNERVMTTLLNQLDGIGRSLDSALSLDTGDEERRAIDELEADVLVVAATNRLDMIDKALLRPGRMDRIIHVPQPDYQTRLKILELLIKDKPVKALDIENLTDRTHGKTGADLEILVTGAGLEAIAERGHECTTIQGHHFHKALEKLF